VCSIGIMRKCSVSDKNVACDRGNARSALSDRCTMLDLYGGIKLQVERIITSSDSSDFPREMRLVYLVIILDLNDFRMWQPLAMIYIYL